MLRVHCTERDLLRSRFLPEPPPMAELQNALMTLRRRDDPLFDPWRAVVRSRFPEAAKPLLDLVFPEACPDFLDSFSPSFEEGLDEVMSRRHALERSLFDDPGTTRRPAPWVRQLAEGGRAARQTLERALKAAHDALLAPLWTRVTAAHHDDLASRRPVVLTEGFGAALRDVFPNGEWDGLVFEVPRRSGLDVHLDGNGITLVPSAFLTGRPLVSRGVPGRPMLVAHPARIPLPLVGAVDDADRKLGPLIGRTRAAVLEKIVQNPAMTTSSLAKVLGISPGRAHEHSAVLRDAGLITSHRYRNTVLHLPTSLGERLLAS